MIAYVLLCGYPPFKDPDINKLFKKIQMCDYEYPPADWELISKEAKDFIDRLIVHDPELRMTPEQAL